MILDFTNEKYGEIYSLFLFNNATSFWRNVMNGLSDNKNRRFLINWIGLKNKLDFCGAFVSTRKSSIVRLLIQ